MTKPANQLTGGLAYVGDISVQSGSVQKVMTGSVARTDTSAKTLGILPASATIIGVTLYSAAASNAGTTATVSVGKSGGTGAEYVNAADVKTTATGAGQVNPNQAILGSVGSSAVTVTALYAETGSASNAGGPWTIVIEYITV